MHVDGMQRQSGYSAFAKISDLVSHTIRASSAQLQSSHFGGSGVD